MSGERHNANQKKDGQGILDEILDFGTEGTETGSSSDAVSERIKEIIKKLQDINRRIDHLSSGS